MFYSWLHLIALIAYLGAIFGFWLILLPSVAALDDHDERLRFLVRGLKFYNPLQIGALGIVLFSGAFELTELKAAYRETFFKEVAYSLFIKLAFAFLLVIFSVYQALGVGHRFVRRHEGGEATTAAEMNALIGRLKNANWIILVLAVVTLWLGLRMRS